MDFDDYMEYADLNHAGFLTEAPETVWPFAVPAGMTLQHSTDFPGNSHDKITKEVWVR